MNFADYKRLDSSSVATVVVIVIESAECMHMAHGLEYLGVLMGANFS